VRATHTPEQIEIEKTLVELAADGLEQARGCLERGYQAPSADAELLEGFSALGVPEELGGFGGGMVDVVVAVEALGRTLLPTRLPSQLAAVHAALAAGIDVAGPLAGAPWTLAADRVSDEPEELGADAVKASRTLVTFPEGAAAVVVLGEDEVAVVPAAGMTPRMSLDPTRPCADLSADCEPVAFGVAASAARRVALVAAADLCGAARGALDLGAAYARDREQFGKAIGSFQGVAFQLADALVGLKAAWDLTVYAAWAVDVDDPGAAAAVHAAKAKAGGAALFAAERTVQVHGGIGITLEADPHLFLRRALFSDAWCGSGREHRLALGRLRIEAGRAAATV
jgi:alkylation response protein AidB-like acyl-CoA dehydrogenase